MWERGLYFFICLIEKIGGSSNENSFFKHTNFLSLRLGDCENQLNEGCTLRMVDDVPRDCLTCIGHLLLRSVKCA